MKRVVLLNPPQVESLDDHLDPPLGLMYLSSNMRAQGIEVSICDLSGKREEEWERNIEDADLYGITLFSASYKNSKKIARIIKERNNNSKLIAGGPHATSLPQETLKDGFDYVIVGEGELVFPELVREIRSGKNIRKIIRTEPIIDLDKLIFPSRDVVNIMDYNRQVDGTKATSIISSRGCPNNCSFCCKDVHGRKIRFRSVDNVIEEVKEIIDKYGINSLLFYDDIFTLNRKRLNDLCEKLKKLDISFRCNGKAGINTIEDYEKLKDAGCREIAFGIESGSQKILDKINKGTSVGENERAILDAKKAGLLTKAYLVVNYPGETQETIDETKRFVERADPDKFTVFQFIPLPGCDVWKNPQKYGVRINSDWNQYFNIAGNYEGGCAFVTEELTPKVQKRFHDDLVGFLINRKENFGQRGYLERYYEKLKS